MPHGSLLVEDLVVDELLEDDGHGSLLVEDLVVDELLEDGLLEEGLEALTSGVGQAFECCVLICSYLRSL